MFFLVDMEQLQMEGGGGRIAQMQPTLSIFLCSMHHVPLAIIPSHTPPSASFPSIHHNFWQPDFMLMIAYGTTVSDLDEVRS